MTTVPEYVTKTELDMRLNVITDRQAQEAERNAERFSSMENLLDSKLTMMQLMMEKNLAQYQAAASDLRAEINDLRGDVKAQGAQLNTLQSKIGYYITILGIGVSVVLVLFQMMMN